MLGNKKILYHLFIGHWWIFRIDTWYFRWCTFYFHPFIFHLINGWLFDNLWLIIRYWHIGIKLIRQLWISWIIPISIQWLNGAISRCWEVILRRKSCVCLRMRVLIHYDRWRLMYSSLFKEMVSCWLTNFITERSKFSLNQNEINQRRMRLVTYLWSMKKSFENIQTSNHQNPPILKFV